MVNTRTAIHVDRKVKERLRKLKIHPRESYNAVVERLVLMQIDEGELCKQTLKEVNLALEDVKAGRTCTMGEVKKRLGII